MRPGGVHHACHDSLGACIHIEVCTFRVCQSFGQWRICSKRLVIRLCVAFKPAVCEPWWSHPLESAGAGQPRGLIAALAVRSLCQHGTRGVGLTSSANRPASGRARTCCALEHPVHSHHAARFLSVNQGVSKCPVDREALDLELISLAAPPPLSPASSGYL